MNQLLDTHKTEPFLQDSMSSPQSRHTSSSSNYDNNLNHSTPVIKPKLDSIETSSASSNKSPPVTDLLPPSNLSDIESVDDKERERTHKLRVVNPETITTTAGAEGNDVTVVQPTATPTKQKRSTSPTPSIQESILSRDFQRTVSVKLSQLHDTSSLESLLAKPAHQQPANLSRALNRESVFSNISQYSGRVELSAQAVPVVLQRSDSTKIKKVRNKNTKGDHSDQEGEPSEMKSVNTADLVETSQLLRMGKTSLKNSPLVPKDNYDVDADVDESDYDESSILMGKLPTTNASDNLQLYPDKTFETSVEGAIPARSPRRPTSMLPPGTTSNEIVSGVGDKAARRRTMQITDDLDQLMQDATSISTFSSMKNHNEPIGLEPERYEDDETGVHSADVVDTNGPHDRDLSDTESRGPEVPSHRYSTGTSSTKMTPLLNKLAVEDEDEDEHFDEDEHSGHGNESDLITISKRETSLPPRPSEGDIRRARNVSANIQRKQQQQQQQGHEEYFVNDENHENDDEYYDIDEPIQHPSRGKSVKSSIRRPARNITNTTPTAHDADEQEPQRDSKASTNKKHKKRSKDKTKHHRHQHQQQQQQQQQHPHHRGGATGVSSRGNELRPFSYKTLVSLLESMNGTIIGEEFNSLNIPIREKQLIEKIIDSLSRLTSDMILDQERYDVGLKRLEKALRVLEGFN